MRIVERILRRERLAQPGQTLLVAVSGGLDSMVLLDVLDRLRRLHRWRLVIAHFNHRLRGKASDADERWVRREAARRALGFVSERADVAGCARRGGLSVEMAARRLRHEFLARVARQFGAKAVALAHHADDQTELFFLRLLRGAGPEGLMGMRYRSPSPANRGVSLVRPLLDVPKSALSVYGSERGLRFREDATNAELAMRRNRVRHRLLPLLAREFQPAVGEVVRRTMTLLGAENDFVRRAATQWLERRSGRPFARLHPAVQRQVIQAQLIRLGVNPTFELVERLRLVPGRRVSAGAEGMIGRRREGVLTRMAEKAPGFRAAEQEVQLSGRIRGVGFGGLDIRWSFGRHSRTPTRLRFGAGIEHFDAREVGSPVTLRHWRPGDRFQPIGMRRSVKLQDLFTNERVPGVERHRRVVATTARGEVFWVEGLRIGERFKLDNQTTTRLKWRWRRGESRVAQSEGA